MAAVKNKIPFGAMSVTESAKRLVQKIMVSGKLTSGIYVRELERQYAELIGTKEAVALSSGTDADILALAVLHDFGAKRGDEIIVPALSFVATGNAVLHAGFIPVFVDVEMESLNINPAQIEKVITNNTKAIMPVHLMGKPALMDTIMEIARRHKLYVIEDAAEAHGSKYKGRTLGSIGDMGAFSLYAAHMISSVEGGMVTTNNSDFAEILRSLRSHGRSCNCEQCVMNTGSTQCEKRFKTGSDKRFIFERIGYSAKMNELEAAVGIGNMEEWPKYLAQRRENFLYLLERFGRFAPILISIKEDEGEFIGPHAFPIILGEKVGFTRDQFVDYLSKQGIDSRNLFWSMPTQCPGFAFLGHQCGEFPVSEYVGKNGLHIGLHQDLNIGHMKYFIDTVEEFLNEHT